MLEPLAEDEVIPVPPAISRVSEPRAMLSAVPESACTARDVDIAAEPAAVKRPCWSTVNVGIAVAEP